MKRISLSIVMLFFVTAFSLPAAAETATSSDLVRFVPKGTKLAAGMEVPKLKTSFLFTEAMAAVRKEARGKTILTFVLNSDAIDFERNVDTMLVAFEKPMVNPQATSTPPAAVVIRGRLDQVKVIEAAKKHFGKLEPKKIGALDVHAGSGLELAFVTPDTLVVVDQGKYSEATWKAAVNEPESAAMDKDLTEIINLVDTTKGFWFAVVTKGIRPPAAAAAVAKMPAEPPKMDGAAVSLALTKGLAAEFNSQFEKPKEAQDALKQFKDLTKENGDDAMIEMIGAKPLVKNLKASVQKQRILSLKTSINDEELKTLFARVKAMAENPPKMEKKKDGEAAPDAKPGESTAPRPTGTGANADFN